MTYYSVHFRKARADARVTLLHRRGLDPSLRRRFGLWVVRVSL